MFGAVHHLSAANMVAMVKTPTASFSDSLPQEATEPSSRSFMTFRVAYARDTNTATTLQFASECSYLPATTSIKAYHYGEGNPIKAPLINDQGYVRPGYP